MVLLLAQAGLGCGPEEPVMVVRTSDPTHHSSGSFGLVTLRQVARAPGSACLKLSGQFVSYRDIHPDAVVRAVDPEIGRLPNEGVPGQCRLLRSDALSEGATGQDPGAQGRFSIDLLDAGGLLLRSPQGEALVAPRDFPDMLSSVAGVVYSSTPADCVTLDGDGELSVEGQGGAEVGSFSVSLPLPQRPEIQEVAGQVAEAGSIAARRGEDLPLRWHQGETPGDFVHVELEGPDARLVCLVEDSGGFAIPEADLDRLGVAGDLLLRVRRIRVQPFLAPGIREGELVTIVEDSTTVSWAEAD